MTWYVVVFGITVLAAGLLLCAVRAVRGPSLFDRVLAFDCMVLHFVGGVLLMSILLETAAYMDVVLIVALLGFLGTVSFAAYLERSIVD